MSTQGPLNTTTIRLDREGIAEVRRHCGGKMGQVVRYAIRRHFGIMRRELPALAPAECRAIFAVLDGWPDWASPEAPRSQRFGPMLADAVLEYTAEYPSFAAEIQVDWKALAEKCRALTDVQVLALCHAAEAMLADHGEGDTEARVRRNFRVS